jgi:hypothetical protein
MNRNQKSFGGLTGAIFIIGLIATFAFGGFNLPIFFATLAFCSLFGSISSNNSGALYGGYNGFVWLMALALFFVFNTWLVFLLAILLMMFMGQIVPTLMNTLSNVGLYHNRPQPYAQPPQQPYYQPSQPYQSPSDPSYTPYQGGYQPPQTYQEGRQHYYYPPQATSQTSSDEQYNAPQAQYPPNQQQ